MSALSWAVGVFEAGAMRDARGGASVRASAIGRARVLRIAALGRRRAAASKISVRASHEDESRERGARDGSSQTPPSREEFSGGGGRRRAESPPLAELKLHPFQRVMSISDSGFDGGEEISQPSAAMWERAGAYAIFDARRALQYVGYSKNIRDKLLRHSRVQRSACQYFKAYVSPDQYVTPDELEAVLDAWLEEVGRIPPGNGAQRALWEVPVARAVLDDRQIDREKRASALVEPASRAQARRERRASEKSRRRPEVITDDREEDVEFEFDDVVRVAKKLVAKTATVMNKGAKQARRVYENVVDELTDQDVGARRAEQRVSVDPLDPFSPASRTPPRTSTTSTTRRRPRQRRQRQKYADPDYDVESSDDDYGRSSRTLGGFDEEWIPVVALLGAVAFVALLTIAGSGPDSLPAVGQVGQQTLPM